MRRTSAVSIAGPAGALWLSLALRFGFFSFGLSRLFRAQRDWVRQLPSRALDRIDCLYYRLGFNDCRGLDSSSGSSSPFAHGLYKDQVPPLVQFRPEQVPPDSPASPWSRKRLPLRLRTYLKNLPR